MSKQVHIHNRRHTQNLYLPKLYNLHHKKNKVLPATYTKNILPLSNKQVAQSGRFVLLRSTRDF